MPNGLAPKTTDALTVEEMAWLAMAEDVLRKLDLTLACPRCLRSGHRTGAVLRGANDTTDHTILVECDCRRLTFHTRAS